ncbi:MAG: outer membrane protein transport protein [Muribaculaceae bacterium]|nr:outer membrane protein transport protein [Muribaculaceae bacterium]
MNITAKIKTIAAVLAAFTALVTATAQNSTISPYSRFGYGLLSEQANASQRGMGGVGYDMRSGRAINFMNPASYAAIDSLTFLFDMGVDGKTLATSQGDLKGHNFTGGLSYVTMQFPMTRYGGAAVGLMPYSEVGYSFGNSITGGHNSREGGGSLSQLFVGLSAKPFKGFTLGANIAYLFGTLNNDTYVYTDQGSTTLFQRILEVRDYNLRLGMQYEFNIGEKNGIGLGVIYEPKKDFRGHTYGMKYDVTLDQNSPDTIGYTSLKGKYQKAETWGAGISYKWNQRLFVEADFTYQPWKKAAFAPVEGFDAPDNGLDQFNDRWRGALGVSYTPNPRGRWASRVNYRLGASYCNDYIKVGDNSVREYGLTLGFGLPAPSSKTMVNLSFEYRHRQASPQPLVKEDYFMFTLGVNVNELWFWRNKLR